MKKVGMLFVTLALCTMLAGCSSNQNGGSHENSGNSSSKMPAEPEEVNGESKGEPEEPKKANEEYGGETNGSKKVIDVSEDEINNMRTAFASALENLIKTHTLPDGTELAFAEQMNMSDNQFAVFDVDQDERDELIIMYSETYSAGMIGCILAFDNDTKELKTELMEFPLLTFYDNGVIKAEWSHNQGLGNDFWPYNLYQYMPASDSYELVGSVDAWQKDYAEVDYQGNPFPSNIDKSGAGFVYYIMPDGEYRTNDPKDQSQYNEWVDIYLGNASEIQIPFMNLTEENIAGIKNGKRN